MGCFIELQIGDLHKVDLGQSDVETEHPTVRIELNGNCESLWSVLDNLIKPALLAAGFTADSVNAIDIVEQIND